MGLVTAEHADDAQQHRARLRPLRVEFDLALADMGFDAVQTFKEVVAPGGTAEFPVGHRFQSDRLLLADHAFDLAIFDRLEVGGADLPPARFSRAAFSSAGRRRLPT